jgi:hypothetical protein
VFAIHEVKLGEMYGQFHNDTKQWRYDSKFTYVNKSLAHLIVGSLPKHDTTVVEGFLAAGHGVDRNPNDPSHLLYLKHIICFSP